MGCAILESMSLICTHMYGLAVYVKEGLTSAQDLSLENSADSYVLSWLYFTVSYFLFLYHHLLCCCAVFYSVSSNIDEVLSINPSANVFAFGDFNLHHRNWLTYSGETDRSGEL